MSCTTSRPLHLIMGAARGKPPGHWASVRGEEHWAAQGECPQGVEQENVDTAMLRTMALRRRGVFCAYSTYIHSSTRVALTVAAILVSLLVLAACGPEGSSSESGSAEEQTQAIARQFAADGNGDAARTALQQLEVANPSQWLTLVTENAISNSGEDPEVTRSLVLLALDMGIREATIRDYAEANGLVEPSIPAAEAATVIAGIQAPVGEAGAPAASAPAADAAAQGGMAAAAGAAAPAESVVVTPTTAPPTETPTPQQPAQVTAAQPANLRQGPGTEYGLAGAFNVGEVATITAKNSAGDWWQITLPSGASGWVYAPLVTATGPVESVSVAADIPTPPAVAAAPAEAAPAAPAPAEPAPAEPAPPAEAPAPEPAAPEPAAPDPNAAPHFSVAERRMWSKEENGGCAGQHLLRIIVVDANGNPLNGITLRGIYTGIELTTGAQGKGDGRIEYDLYGTGEGFIVARNNDGRDATSENAEGFTTKSLDIDIPTLIGGGYCTNDADCQVFYNSYGCTGHHSWQATFKRNY